MKDTTAPRWDAQSCKSTFTKVTLCAMNPVDSLLLIFGNNTLPTVKRNLRAFERRTIDGSVRHLQRLSLSSAEQTIQEL